MRASVVFTVFLIAITIIALSFYWWLLCLFGSGSNGLFTVHFLQVGQGDAVLLETPDGKQVLIDGGRGTSVIRALGEVLPTNDNTIDVVIATHPDADHIGGLIGVLDRFDVDTIIHTNVSSNSKVYKSFIDRVKKEVADGAQEYIVKQPSKFKLGEVSWYILWPNDSTVSSTNASSIVLVARYNDADVFLSGDAPVVIEEYVAQQFPEILKNTELIKAGHHGSKTSTGEQLLTATGAKLVVISAGANNSYGHPHEIVTQRIAEYNAQQIETKNGTITFTSSGEPFTQFIQN